MGWLGCAGTAGSAPALWRAASGRTQIYLFHEALLRRRNLAWAEALAGELETAHSVELVNAGALHLVGDDGLPALVAGRGSRVERAQ